MSILAAALLTLTSAENNPPAGMKLVWSDEFNYTGLPDPKKWDYEVGHVRNNELQYYTKARKENARVEGGKLIIEGRKEEHKGSKFTAASLITLGKFAFQYGRIEISAKMPKALGTWPALWMMGEDINEVGWPRCAEVDIMEFVGHEPGTIYGTLHQIDGKGGHWSKGSNIKVPDCSDAFHVYAVEWTPKSMDWFVDDKKHLSFPYEGPSKWTMDRRMYLLMNLAIGGDWGALKGVDEAAFPQRYEIDYVRVYQKVK